MSNPRNQSETGSPNFKTTRWSIVLNAGNTSAEESRQALEELYTIYWYPLYAFSRRSGDNDHDAMDLTQGFLMHVLCSNALQSVGPEKGRFRSFLLASFRNFISNQRRAAGAIRRGGNIPVLSLSTEIFDERYSREPASLNTPELLYQRAYVKELLDRVYNRLEDDYRRADKSRLFVLLRPHLSGCNDAISRPEIGNELKLTSAAIAMSLHRMRRRYRELLREEVSSTVDDPSEIDDEIRSLMQIVSQSE